MLGGSFWVALLRNFNSVIFFDAGSTEAFHEENSLVLYGIWCFHDYCL